MVPNYLSNRKACVKHVRGHQLRGVLVIALLFLSFMLTPAASFKRMSSTTSVLKHRSRASLRCAERPGTHGPTKKASYGEGCNICDESCRLDRRELVSRALRSTLTLSWTLGVAATSSFRALAEEVAQVAPEDEKVISYDNFQRLLLKSQVVKCDFYGANFEKAIVQLVDGTRAVIGEGYPKDEAFSDDSPLKVVAALRNAGVPFTTQFNTKPYAKPQAYKSTETLQAEARQRQEDEAMDRLMSQ